MNNLFIAVGSLVAGGIISSTGNFIMQVGNATREQVTNILQHPAVNQVAQAAQTLIDQGPANDVLNNYAVPTIMRPAQRELVAHPLRESSTIAAIARSCYIWGCENIGSLTLVGLSYLLLARFRGTKPSLKALKANGETLNQIQREAVKTALDLTYKTQIGAIITVTVCLTDNGHEIYRKTQRSKSSKKYG